MPIKCNSEKLYKLEYNLIYMHELLIKKTKEKKSLINLDDEIVEGYIKDYFKKNPKIKVILENHSKPGKSKEFKNIIKEIRNNLNRIYGQFQLNKNLTLESHASTKERINIYPHIYKKIFSITGEPKTILDISSGLNPLSYKYLGCKPYYIATELAKYDCEILKGYFKKENISGKVLQINLLKENRFPKADISFLFKVLDILNNKKLAENIIKNLDARYIVASFSLITVKGKRMNYPMQGWFQRMLKRLNLNYTIIKEENEIFYVIKKGL